MADPEGELLDRLEAAVDVMLRQGVADRLRLELLDDSARIHTT